MRRSVASSVTTVSIPVILCAGVFGQFGAGGNSQGVPVPDEPSVTEPSVHLQTTKPTSKPPPSEVKVTGKTVRCPGYVFKDQELLEVSGTLNWASGEKPPRHIAVLVWPGKQAHEIPSKFATSGATWGKLGRTKVQGEKQTNTWTAKLKARYVGFDDYVLAAFPLDEQNKTYKDKKGRTIVWTQVLSIRPADLTPEK
jgi:hypothetical protein